MDTKVRSAKSVFLNLVEGFAPDQWPKLLDEHCGSNVPLRCEVERLLSGHTAELDLVKQGEAALREIIRAEDQPSVISLAGTQIGPYQLLEQIGEGGMGVVFMAEQLRPVRRRVALKVIKPGMDTREVIGRFEAERQALAMMEHPNIAKVHDAGATENGRPYFVMELVHGVPITEYCNQCNLTTRERLQLFVLICQAVQHAHQKGVIHRDLKPTNIMVAIQDGRPAPKIIDFGVAKAIYDRLTEYTLATGFAQMIGTPTYMSPEQAELSPLGADTRSDIYSLGVLLYELLTGTTPFDKGRLHAATYDELRRIIREEEPPRPSARLSTLAADLATTIAEGHHTDARRLLQLVRGELDWIVMKCLEKDRNRRYQTAIALAQDVERYLGDEPVVACPPSTVYWLRKFARRNKAAIVMGSVIGGALLAVVSAVAGSIGWAARDHAARQTRLAGQVGMILEDVDRFATEQKWSEAISTANRAEAMLQSGDAGTETADRVRHVLADLRLLEQLEKARLLSSQWTDGNFNYRTADQAYARAFAEAGLAVEGVTVEQAANQMRAHEGIVIPLATALTDWADVRLLRTESDDSTWQHLLAVANAIDPDPWRQRLRAAFSNEESGKALRDFAASTDVRSLPPATVLVLISWLRERGHDSANLLRAAQQQLPSDFWVNFELAVCLHTSLKQLDDAIVYYRVAHALRPDNGAVLNNLGSALKDMGKLDEAIATLQMAIEIDPNYPSAHYNLGSALHAQGKLDEAISCYLKAIELDPEYAFAYTNLGLVLKDQKKLDEAIKCYRKTIEIDPNVKWAHYNLGWALKDTGKLHDAIAAFQETIKIDPMYELAHYGLGTTLLDQGKLDEAVSSLRKAIELKPEHAQAHCNLGNALFAQHHHDEAIACFRTAIALDPKLAPAHFNLSQALEKQGKLDEALPHLRKAVELCEANPLYADIAPAYNSLAWHFATFPNLEYRDPARAVKLAQKAVERAPQNGAFWNTLGVAQYRASDYQKAIAALEKSIDLRNGGDGADWFFLAMAHWHLGNQDEAQKWYAKAVVKKNNPNDMELIRFRGEAAQLLGLAEPKSAIELQPKNDDGPATLTPEP